MSQERTSLQVLQKKHTHFNNFFITPYFRTKKDRLLARPFQPVARRRQRPEEGGNRGREGRVRVRDREQGLVRPLRRQDRDGLRNKGGAEGKVQGGDLLKGRGERDQTNPREGQHAQVLRRVFAVGGIRPGPLCYHRWKTRHQEEIQG